MTGRRAPANTSDKKCQETGHDLQTYRRENWGICKFIIPEMLTSSTSAHFN
jgi:hypothetical protein